MAQLYFYYGTMNSGKSIEILKVAHSYEEANKKVLLLTSGIDNRTKIGTISSRIGLSKEAYAVFKEDDLSGIYNLLIKAKNENNPYDVIIIDEVQFFTKEQIIILSNFVDELHIPILCYGLKNDFKNNIFEGSLSLLAYADKIIEIKSVCSYCNHKATMNLRLSNGKPTQHGEQIQIGGNESYVPTCRKCYNNLTKGEM